MNSTDTLAFIGAGNLATSLIRGLLQTDIAPDQLIASNPDPEALKTLHAQFGIRTHSDNIQAASGATVVFLCVKPQILQSVLTELNDTLQKNKPLIISVAAGSPLQLLESHSSAALSFVRAMPNLAATVQASATALIANCATDAAKRQTAESLLRAVGQTLWLDDEAQMDAVTAVSGSGPAYFFLLMEALIEAGVAQGLSREQAKKLTLQTALGAARVALNSEESPASLREQVTSKGGTTASALAVLNQHNFLDLINQAVTAAAERSAELADN